MEWDENKVKLMNTDEYKRYLDLYYEINKPKKKKLKKYLFEKNGKECKQCLDFKKLDDFCYSSYTKDKKSIYCKQCSSLNHKLQLKTNINLRLGSILRTRINFVLKSNKKASSTKNLLGCSIEFFKNYIESKFKPNMTWNNYGNKKGIRCWEIDHIKPCASFDLSKPEEQRKCFHYTNLQPLWAIENRQKSNK